MLTSHRKSQNYGDLRGGETLFQFLKRKKKVSLELSLSRGKRQNAKSFAQTYSPRHSQKQVRFEDTLQLQSDIKYNTYRSKNKQTRTPPKNIQGEQTNAIKKTKHNSFIEMISPLRKHNLNQQSLTPDKPYKQVQSARYRDDDKQNIRNDNKKKIEEVYYRQNLNKSISVMKQTLLRYINQGKSIKSKAHTLFIELKPILKFVEEGKNNNFAQKASEIKLKLRTFQHLFKQFDVENNNQIIQKFHRTLSEHIVSLQGKIRSQLEKGDIASLTRIRQQKDSKIEQLSDEKFKLQKQLDIMKRKLQKTERQFDKLQDQAETNSDFKNNKFQSQNALNQEKITQYQNQLDYLAKEIDASKQREKNLQKKVKDALYLKEEAERRFIEQNTKIKTTKQQYLLNEIQILKKQFKSDMKQLNSLYSEKQHDHKILIQQLRKQIAEHKQLRRSEKQTEKKAIEQTLNSKTQMQKYRKQNQCLITDLNRMNQQLYQHWLGLKDIKTLAVRLKIYNKFMRIYDDLSYNDQLFV